MSYKEPAFALVGKELYTEYKINISNEEYQNKFTEPPVRFYSPRLDPPPQREIAQLQRLGLLSKNQQQ